MRSHRAKQPARDAATTFRRWSALLVLAATVGVLTITVWRIAGDGHPYSLVDETVHADTAFKVHQGEYPARGSKLSQETIDTWHCYTGHSYVKWTVACGSKKSRPELDPAGAYTTGYIHYPTYFLGGEVFRWIHDTTLGAPRFAIDTYRQYSAFLMVLGVLACAAMAWLVGLRGAPVVAAALAPVAAPAILSFAAMVNPTSASTLCGALIAGLGIRWMMTGRGFWWLAAATGFAACVAVTSSLPAGVFLLAAVFGLVLRRLGHKIGDWAPRWWQPILLGAMLVVPIVAFGWWTDSRATMTNEQLYDGYIFGNWRQVAVGVWSELLAPHFPWGDDTELVPQTLGSVRSYARGVVTGLPTWLSLMVAGTLVAGAVGVVRPKRPTVETDAEQNEATPGGPGERRAAISPLAVLCMAAVVGFVAYPPLLRLSNAMNAGVDYVVVARYSISLTPLFVLITLLLAKDRPWFGRVLATLATLSVAAWCVTVW